jgi:protein arginine kinase activator
MAERPLECSDCKKPIAVNYTEIVGDNITCTSMCADCPVLQRRLHGTSNFQLPEKILDSYAGLCCGTCGTTLDAIRMGTPLGCSECYEVFGDILVQELINTNRISQRMSNKKSTPIHIGRSPGETTEMNPSLRLLALNEALNETLTREDYEQAAWLRDQIKELMEKPNEGTK